jgi:hypothetical protein
LTSNGTYDPLFVEETWVIRFYGNIEENESFDKLMENRDDHWNRIEIVLLVEKIKERNKLGLLTQCCDSCPHFENCRINWRRGELDLATTCCANCPNYTRCSRDLRELNKASEDDDKASEDDD